MRAAYTAITYNMQVLIQYIAAKLLKFRILILYTYGSKTIHISLGTYINSQLAVTEYKLCVPYGEN